MATRWRLYVGIALGLGLLASTAACDGPPPAPVIGEPVQIVAPVTSLVTVTSAPSPIPDGYVDDCVEYVQFAAYVGIADMATIWQAAGMDVQRLRENCTSLGRGDPAALADIARRRAELDAFLNTTTTLAI
jgi:hypothetical protein